MDLPQRFSKSGHNEMIGHGGVINNCGFEKKCIGTLAHEVVVHTNGNMPSIMGRNCQYARKHCAYLFAGRIFFFFCQNKNLEIKFPLSVEIPSQ